MIKNTFLALLSSLIIILATLSCDDNLEAELPSYIHIDSFLFTESESEPGVNENITDAWISMNGQVIGVFEMPSTIPILSVGNQSFDIYPGIKVNGISGNRAQYPFYKKYTTSETLSLLETITIEPTTSYKDGTSFLFKTQGQFEIDGTMLEKTLISDTSAIIQEEIVFQGSRAAAIYLDENNTYFDIRNIEELNLETNTFLELNFKSNISFNIGIVIKNNIEEKQELIQIYPSDEWKKIYLDLSTIISMGNSLSTFKIYLDGNYDSTQELNAIYIDNLKLVY
jgi:hypothetical protein